MANIPWGGIASVVVAALVAAIGAIVAARPETLGLDPIVQSWLGIVLVALGPISAALANRKQITEGYTALTTRRSA